MLDTEKLRELRKRKGLTQQAVADKMGLTRVAITQYEKGVRTPKIDIAYKLARIYGVKVDDLVK
jgi:transcriptional regulator with XRE-family HTH domain